MPTALLIVVVVLCWPVSALGQSAAQTLLNSVHDEESLLAASRPNLDPRALDDFARLSLIHRAGHDIAVLGPGLDDTNPYVRWTAAMALVGNGLVPGLPARLVPVLVDAIKQGGPEVRKLAFRQLGSLSSYRGYADICAPAIDEAVIAGMQEPLYGEVNSNATRAITACPSLPVSIVAREIAASHSRQALIEHLERRGPEAQEASEALIMALRDDDWPTSGAAARTLRLSGVAPERYVPLILEDLAASKDELTRTRAVRTLTEVAPVASRWAPEVITLLDDEDRPHIRAQLRIALNGMGTPEATRAASRNQLGQSAATVAPLIFLLAAAGAVAVLLAKNGWGVLLGFLFTALSLISLVLDNASDWMIAAILTAPLFSLAGAFSGFYFARRAESEHKRLVGRIGGGISVAALLFTGLAAFGLYGMFSLMGAG